MASFNTQHSMTKGRIQTMKDQLTLSRAFIHALEMEPALKNSLRLILIGAPTLRAECQKLLDRTDIAELPWLPDEPSDVPEVMRGLGCFVLPSLAEGISNTILKTMASGLPVMPTNVGGNTDLVVSGSTVEIIPTGDPKVIARKTVEIATAPKWTVDMGSARRAIVEKNFSMKAMVTAYQRYL